MSPKRKAPSDGAATSRTLRDVRREEEERRYTPVIVKRNDESRRHPDDTLQEAIREGLEQLNRPAVSLFLSSIVAGLTLGFTAMSVASVTVIFEGAGLDAFVRLGTALVYPFGFVICLMSGAELFTEHTATAVYPALDRRAAPAKVFRLWVIVIAGNIVGAFVASLLLLAADPVVGAREGYVTVGRHLFEVAPLPLLASSILAGSLMALGAWLILSTPPTVSQLASIWVVTFVIGLGDLHHSIAGSAEAFTAMWMSADVGFTPVWRFVSLALFGNLLGGSLFVAVFNYAHIRRSRTLDDDDGERGPSSAATGR